MKKDPEDLSIPDYLLVKNRPKSTISVDGSAAPPERIPEPHEPMLATLEPKLQEYLRDANKRGKFEWVWLVPIPRRRSQGDVDETVAHWRGKLEKSLSQSAARAEQAKAKRTKETKVTAPSRIDEAEVIRFGGKNPKKEGTAAHKRWEMLISYDGKTVGAYHKAKGNPTTLRNAIVSGHVTLETEKGGSSTKQKTRKKD
jgi:hypothetical protein